ncbi:MAG: hypothetical protein AB8F74_05995 [Saprospiraceae bacterium]
MNRYSLFLLLIAVLFCACKSDSTSATTGSDKTASSSSSSQDKKTSKERLTVLAKDNPTLREISKTINGKVGHNMISSLDLDANNNLTINFFENADAYNKAYDGVRKKLNDQLFEKFWLAGSRVEKAICGLAGNILYDHQSINGVKVNLSTGKETKKVNITREGLTKVTGLSWEQLISDWTANYTNVILHDPEKREYVIRALSE